MKNNIQHQKRINTILTAAIITLLAYSVVLTFMHVSYVDAHTASDNTLADKLSDVDQRLFKLESK